MTDVHGLSAMESRIAKLEGRVDVLSERTTKLIGTRAEAVEDRANIDALRRAAHVLRRRSRKPHKILPTVMRRILNDLAATIEDELEDVS